jgi:hypothetical protein
MTQPLTWPFLIALAELRWLEETDNQMERENMVHIFEHSSAVTIATGNIIT